MLRPFARSAVLIPDIPSTSDVLRGVVEPLTLALALSVGTVGAYLGWHAHERVWVSRTQPRVAAEYVDALCRDDVAYLRRRTGEEVGPMPWEVRLNTWAQPCVGYRYLGSSSDRIGRQQHVFALVQRDNTEVLFVVTIGHDGLVARID